MTEDKEKVELRYTEALSDFAGVIQEHGAKKVAEDFHFYYPTQAFDLVEYVFHIQREKRIAAILKP